MSTPDLDPQRSLPAPLWKKLAGIWSLVAVFVAAVWLWPESSPSKTAGPEGLRPASCEARPPSPRLLTTPIEEIRVFDWVVAENPYGSSSNETVDAVDWADWRVLSLRMLKPDGSAAEVELARPLAWVESQEATVGGAIWLDFPEMGISGWAEVGSIGKCPDPGPPPSPRHWLVTATFKHTSAEVVRLHVSGEAQPLGVTASHSIWSVDRRAFVEVGTLDQGERVLGLDGGEHLVAALLPRPGSTAVYNLEVYGAHVYHVGASGLLAHNMCAAERAGKGARAPVSRAVTDRHHPLPKFLGGDAAQSLSRLHPMIHREFHSLLCTNLKKAGIPLTVGGRSGSAFHWARYMRANPGAQRKAFDAILDTSRSIDIKYGTSLTQDVWDNVLARGFTPYP